MAVDPPCRLADVDGEVGGALDLGDDAHRRDHPTEVAGDGRLQGEQLVARLVELERLGVDLVVGKDHQLGALEVLGEEDVGRPRDALGHLGRELGDAFAQLVELGVERSAQVASGIRSDTLVREWRRTHPNLPVTYISVRSSEGLEKIFVV